MVCKRWRIYDFNHIDAANNYIFIFASMWAVCKKEFRQFFSSLTGYIAIIVFLLLTGLLLFVFPDTSILDFGYASLEKFFDLAPWVLLLLIPAISMRSFSEEFRSGTFEILQSRPLTLLADCKRKISGCPFCDPDCPAADLDIFFFSPATRYPIRHGSGSDHGFLYRIIFSDGGLCFHCSLLQQFYQ